MGLKPPKSELDPIDRRFFELENLVVAGKHSECREVLDGIQPRAIPRSWAARFGMIAFRVHHPTYTLKVLHRFIYPENHFDEPATVQEKTVYASALYTFGAIDESLKILDSMGSGEIPEVWFHTAGAHFCSWNYEAGIPYFKKYIQSSQIDSYKRLVGKVNLASAFIFTCDWDSARELLDQAMTECQSQNYRLLLGNCYELLAQIEIFQGRYENALELLDRAMESLKDQGGFYELYAEKWRLIALCMKDTNLNNLNTLKVFRGKAFALGHWNTVRECDLFEGLVTKNDELIRKVIMGTPYEPYRRRVRKLFDTHLIAKGQYELLLTEGDPRGPETPIFDPNKKGTAPGALYERPLLLALYNALLSDFYQPANLGRLFQKIYPDEKFNPYSSPDRVLKLLKRLNTWFGENGYPIQISFKKSEFRLLSSTPIVVVVHRGASLSATDGKISELKGRFQSKTFSTADVCETLGISKSSANRLLAEALKEGKLIKDKARIGRTYCFSQSNVKRRAA
jgi:tetratricopeptide (TPR) repeat protein